jgi:hypothetical protein
MITTKLEQPDDGDADVGYPRLVSFPQGLPRDADQLDIELYKKGAGKKRKRLLITEAGSIEYRGVDFGEGSMKTDLCKFAVGVLDKASMQMRVYPADHIFVMKQQFKTNENLQKLSTLTYMERRQSLTEEFGSRKKKRALSAAQSNQISAENISGAGAVEMAMSDSIVDNDRLESDEAIGMVDAAEAALEENRRKLLPPYDESARSAKEVYPVSGLISNRNYDSLLRTYDSIMEELAEGRTDLYEGTMISRMVLLASLQGYFSAFDESEVVFSALSSALPHSLGDKIDSTRAEIVRKKLSLIFLLHFAMRYTIKLASNTHGILRDDVDESLSDAPKDVLKQLNASYAQTKMKNKKAVISVTKQDM